MSDHLAGERAADQLRREILQGEFPPGERLDEVSLAARLEVSRNTLREAFRLLGHERLVQHERNRGVFVRRVDARQARESYEVRRHLECGGVREAAVQLSYAHAVLAGEMPSSATAEQRARATVDTWDAALREAERAVADGEAAAAADDWHAVGTANAHFHRALGALGGNPVLEAMVGSLVTESRLRFLLIDDPMAVHQPFVVDNRRILTLLQLGEGVRAAAELEGYLLRAQALLASDDDEDAPRD